jgi:hypothetical protein
MDGLYEVEMVVPRGDTPYLEKYHVTQKQLDEVLEGYLEFAANLVSMRRRAGIESGWRRLTSE